MKRTAAVILCLVSLFMLEALVSGCSLIGLAVDTAQVPDTVSVDPLQGGLEGKTVLITLRNGERFAASCAKVGSLPMELYRPRYLRWEKEPHGSGACISLNDTLHISWDNGQIMVGTLQGFTRTAVVIFRQGVSDGFLRHRGQALSIPVTQVDSLWTLRGAVCDGRTLQRRLDDGAVPTADALLVRRGESVAWVALDDVASIAEVRHSYEWFNKGALADGAGLVVAVVYLVSRKP